AEAAVPAGRVEDPAVAGPERDGECLESDEALPPGMELCRLLLFDHAEAAVPAGRVEDPAVAGPERDMVDRLPVRHEVADAGRRDLLPGLVLLVGVPWNELPAEAVGHVDETGAVDPALRQPAPLVRRSQVRP